MSDQRLTQSPEKAKQRIAHRESRLATAPTLQGGIHPILHLQRTIGNRRVAQLIQAKQLTLQGKILGLQRKLTVGAADDQYEQEADRVADQVMRMPDRALARSSIDPTLTRALSIQRKCQGCEDEENLQRQTRTPHTDTPSSGLDRVAATLSQSGQPLDANTRAIFEPRFGTDFSAVRIHTDSQAAESARSVNALAYTVGRDVVFNTGQYAPHNDSGRRLLAHELTHVLQQGGAEQVQRQTAPAAPAKKTLTLNITKVEGSTRSTSVSDASTILDAAANIKIAVGTVKTLTKAESEGLIGTDLVLDEFSTPGSPTAEEVALTAVNRSAGTITAYFVKALSAGSHGEAFRPSAFPTVPASVVLKNGDSPFVAGKPLAHELGHILLDQGTHPADTTNLMSYSHTGVGLTSAEVSTARSSPFVK